MPPLIPNTSSSYSELHALISPPPQPALPPPRRSRKVLTLLLACLAFLGIAAALKAGHTGIENMKTQTTGITQIKPPVMDDAFMADPKPSTQSSKPAETVISKPSTPVAAKPKAPADAVTADAYIVGDVETGKIYLQKNPTLVLPFASMSKLITAFVATDMSTTSRIIEVSQANTEVPPDASNLKAGEKFTLKELLYPMLLNSSNVAAEAIASSVARNKFLENMAAYSEEIGMPGAFFADPTGVSPQNAGTANGFFAMAQYIYKKRPDILAITRVVATSTATTTEHGAHVFTNIHPFVTDKRFLGGKTGHTPEALDTMLTIMNIRNHPIAVIVLHSSQGRAIDTQILLDRVEKLLVY